MEPWVSVTFHLPATLGLESRAYLRAIDHLKSQNPGLGGGYVGTGKDDLPTVYRYRWVEERSGFGRAMDALYCACYPGSIKDPTVLARIEAVREEIEKIYDAAGARQDEIICTVHQIERLTKPKSGRTRR